MIRNMWPWHCCTHFYPQCGALVQPRCVCVCVWAGYRVWFTNDGWCQCRSSANNKSLTIRRHAEMHTFILMTKNIYSDVTSVAVVFIIIFNHSETGEKLLHLRIKLLRPWLPVPAEHCALWFEACAWWVKSGESIRCCGVLRNMVNLEANRCK